jgi:hypothetical protein
LNLGSGQDNEGGADEKQYSILCHLRDEDLVEWLITRGAKSAGELTA